MTTKVVMAIMDCLECDNQLSVRYIMEWLVVLLVRHVPSTWKQLLLPQLQMVYDLIINSIKTNTLFF